MARKRALRNPPPASTTTPRQATGILWRAAVIVAAGCLAYSNSLSIPFIMDDALSIVENETIREWWNLGSVLFPQREFPTAGRPLVNFSFAVNYALGGLNVWGYHVFNLACHLLAGLLIFGLVRRTLQLPRLDARFGRQAIDSGFASALLWTLHPLNSEAVNYLTQRTELMMALFYLLTLYASVRALGPRAGAWSAVAVLSCAAGMACKESMVTAPVMVVLYDAIFVFESPARALKGRWRLYAGLAMGWGVLAAVNWSGPRVHSAGFSSGADPWTYLLNQTVMITHYLGLAVWPYHLVVNYGWPLDVSLRDVWPYAVFVSALVVLTILALARQPRLGFLGAWFFVTLAPTSSIVPIATEVGAERRMYLPIVAVVVLAVVTGSLVKRATPAARAFIVGLAATLLMAGTLLRNREYQSELVLARTVVERHPTSVAHHYLAVQLLDAGDRDAAMSELRQAIPEAPRAHYTLGVELLKDGKTVEGIEHLQTFLREQPMLLEAVSARQMLGGALIDEERWDEAIDELQMVMTMKPSDTQRVETHRLLADALFGAKRFEEAILECRQFLRARPNDSRVLTRLGAALVETGRLEESIDVFRRAVEHDPGNAAAQRNLASMLYRNKDFADALGPAERAVSLQPADPDARVLLGRLLALQGRFEEARSQFARALQIDPAHVDAQEDLRKLQMLIGR
jgi:tetratricopeptide (TPR) repeat protein